MRSKNFETARRMIERLKQAKDWQKKVLERRLEGLDGSSRRGKDMLEKEIESLKVAMAEKIAQQDETAIKHTEEVEKLKSDHARKVTELGDDLRAKEASAQEECNVMREELLQRMRAVELERDTAKDALKSRNEEVTTEVAAAIKETQEELRVTQDAARVAAEAAAAELAQTEAKLTETSKALAEVSKKLSLAEAQNGALTETAQAAQGAKGWSSNSFRSRVLSRSKQLCVANPCSRNVGDGTGKSRGQARKNGGSSIGSRCRTAVYSERSGGEEWQVFLCPGCFNASRREV